MTISTGTPARVHLTLSLEQAEALYWAIDTAGLAQAESEFYETAAHVEADLAATLEDLGVDLSDDEPDPEPDEGGHRVIAIDVPDFYDPAVVIWAEAFRPRRGLRAA